MVESLLLPVLSCCGLFCPAAWDLMFIWEKSLLCLFTGTARACRMLSTLFLFVSRLVFGPNLAGRECVSWKKGEIMKSTKNIFEVSYECWKKGAFWRKWKKVELFARKQVKKVEKWRNLLFVWKRDLLFPSQAGVDPVVLQVGIWSSFFLGGGRSLLCLSTRTVRACRVLSTLFYHVSRLMFGPNLAGGSVCLG